ncbi:MAG: hypothetical protein JXN65_00575 [Clostridia bacterium]|nr:hypothetical protein [Clostridia bacterium]
MIIDFDNKFREYLQKWMKENADQYKTPEDMEADAMDLYADWMNSPADWLEGEAPAEYYAKFESAEELISILVEHLNSDVGVPDLLLDAISEFGDESKDSLVKLIHLEYDIVENKKEEAQMLAINLITELDDTFLFDEYIDMLFNEKASEDICGLIIERFEFAGKEIAEKILAKLSGTESELVKLRCADVLVNFPGDDRIYNLLSNMFNEYTDTALLAAYLGKYGDNRALAMLKEALDWPDINYLDYIEIRHAIEELGSECEHYRKFEGDPYYESLKNLE